MLLVSKAQSHTEYLWYSHLFPVSFPHLNELDSSYFVTVFEGSGVQIGNGYVLTSRHVIEPYLDSTFDSFYIGQKHLYGDWWLIILPEQGTYSFCRYDKISPLLSQKRNDCKKSSFQIHPNTIGQRNDWALVFNSKLISFNHSLKIRPTHTLMKKEKIWIIGNQNQTKNRISLTMGLFTKAIQSNGTLDSVRTTKGFSGSPLLDQYSNLIGIHFSGNSQKNLSHFVTIESITPYIKKASSKYSDIPELKPW